MSGLFNQLQKIQRSMLEQSVQDDLTSLAQKVSQVNGINPDSSGHVTIPIPSAVHASITQFPRTSGETDDAPRIRRALASLTNGGILEFEVAEYQIASTVTIPQNVTIMGQGYGKWVTGTSFRYLGNGGACFNFGSATDGIKLENFKIYANSGDVSYQNFTGIDVTAAELVKIRNVMIRKANIGVLCSATANNIYLLDIDNIFIDNCKNEGILVQKPPGTNWCNGIRIKVGDISYNNIGIHCQWGNGNTIIGDASEVGNNTVGGILIEAGAWTIKGNLWIENSPYGIQTTGGHTVIDGDVYCVAPILKNGGSLIGGREQAVVNFIPQWQLKKGLVFWYSFEEGTGSFTYDRTNSYKATLTGTWNNDSSVYGSNVTVTSGEITLPTGKLNWLQDWTVLFLTYGSNTSHFLLVKGSDGTKNMVLRSQGNGSQVAINSTFAVNFQTYSNGDATQKMTWQILSYQASTQTITGYSPSGKVAGTYSLVSTPIDSTLGNESLLSIGGVGQVVDETIIYNRIISDSEIRAIVNMTIPPDVRNPNNRVLTSPDGSVWKQTIDNTGVTTWVKL